MKILVCGGRDYFDSEYLFEVLDYIHNEIRITNVVNGAASGADLLSSDWANVNNIDSTEYPADWDHYGRAAGPIRNQEMVDKEKDIDFALVFPSAIVTGKQCY